MDTISDIKAAAFRIPAKRPYRMAGMQSGGEFYTGVLVTLTTASGHTGIGECFVTKGWYAADSLHSTLGMIDHVFAPGLHGISVFDTARIATRMDDLWELGNHFPKCAVEMAAHDVAAKIIRRPVCDLLGGRVRDAVDMAAGIGSESPEVMASLASEYVAGGFRTVKLKLGAKGDPGLDVSRVRHVREAVGSDVRIRVDANGVFTVPEAIRLIRLLEPYDIEHVEQPVPGWHIEGMADVRRAIGIDLMADECVHTLHDVYRVAQLRAADVVKLKIAKNGGFRKARQIAGVCAAAGLGVVIGQGFGSSVQALAELQFACSHPEVNSAGEFVGPDKLEGDVVDAPLRFVEGKANLPDRPGLGADLALADMKRFSV